MILFSKQDQTLPRLPIINLSLVVFVVTIWCVFNYLRLGLENAWLQTAKLAIISLFFVVQDFNLSKSIKKLYLTIGTA
jgi:hypothetical protein